METRICSLCETEKPITEFLERADRPSKKYSRCKDCHREVKRKLAIGIYPYPDKKCKFCGITFRPKSPNQLFHSPSCKEKWNNAFGSMTIHRQYERISGNWPKYFHRLITQKKRQLLTIELLLSVLKKQNYKCALSGVQLTCELVLGTTCNTNASIDRIEHGSKGGLYIEDNIRLVCSIVNKMRQNLTDEEFLYWCRLISEGGKNSCPS